MDERRREALFRQVVDDHSAALARLCAGYERSEARRSELQQEILLNVWRALPSFREDATLRTWLYRVAHNVATRHIGRAVREPKGDADESTADVPSRDSAVDAEVERGRARARLRELIGGLRPLDRQLIMLYLEDVPQKEIADITGLTQANVSTRVHRIKEQLAEGMKP